MCLHASLHGHVQAHACTFVLQLKHGKGSSGDSKLSKVSQPSEMSERSKVSEQILKELTDWTTRVPAIPWWTSTRPLRVASDCSGMCIPEIALQMLCKASEQSKMSKRFVRTVFACDVMKSSQKWMAHLGLKPVLADMNCRIWNQGTRVMSGKTIDGELLRINAKDADVDVYVCGFMCTPFTPNGLRKSWQDEHANTFWSSLKTIAIIQPRVFILENVMAISNNSNSSVVRSALSKLSAYMILHLKVNTSHWSAPRHRPRVYVVGLRKDVVKPCFSNRSIDVVEMFFTNKVLATGRPQKDLNFHTWLAGVGLPVVFNEAKPEESAKTCTCAVNTVCDMHPCKCAECGDHGVNKMKCKWRANARTFMKAASVRKKRAAYLKLWRRVKKDNKLKKVPSYADLARLRNIATAHITRPSQRQLLDTTSQFVNLTTAKAVLNLGKSIGRAQVRTDGLVPTLGHGCTSLYFPGAGTFVTVPQLLALTGLHPKEHARHFEFAKSLGNDIDIMVGNAMCVPVVGSIMGTALSMCLPDVAPAVPAV